MVAWWIQVKTPLDLSIHRAGTVEELRAASRAGALGPEPATSFLSKLAALSKGPEEATVLETPEVAAAIEAAVGGAGELPVGSVVFAYRSLLFLGLPPEDARLERLRAALAKIVGHLPYGPLVAFAAYHADFAEATPSAKKLQQKLEGQVRVPWFAAGKRGTVRVVGRWRVGW